MIAIDTNILVYAHREDSEWHTVAFAKMKELLESGLDWAIPWPCIHEFIAIVTHAKIYKPPTPMQKALDQVDAWMESPRLRLLGEGQSYWERIKQLSFAAKAQGALIHDTRVVALCMDAGISAIWTADRDFSRFEGIKIQNPLL